MGAVLGAPAAALGDPQDVLLADLVGFMTRDTPSVQHVLELVTPHLRAAAGLTAATVFELDAETGLLNAVAQVGEPGRRDVLVAGKVFRLAAGAAPKVTGEHMAVRLRIGGQTVGVLLLTGTDLGVLRPEILAEVALHFASTLQSLAAETQRQFVSHVSTTIRRLFELGMAATTVEAAGQILAASTAEAFRTQYATLHLIDPDGRIRYVHSTGLAEDQARLVQGLVGKNAIDSPVWRSIAGGRPALVGDVTTAQVRKGGLVEILGLRCYLALPLLSSQGPVGMILCGDASGTRNWTSPDRVLAEQLSVEGALIVDSAEMRQAAQAHVAQLSHQAFHDSLTGLPNRSELRTRASETVQLAAVTGERTALLMLDLNGFKEVNDTAGHHAGDVLLQRVARRLLGAVRDGDVVARLGGDEFAVLLTRDPDATVAERVAQRIVERLAEPFDIDGTEVRIGGSVGIALFPDDAREFDPLMRAADAAMYEAKRETKRDGGGFRTCRPG
jgi:diguanylate cyclase (GGDEF)-like protein